MSGSPRGFGTRLSQILDPDQKITEAYLGYKKLSQDEINILYKDGKYQEPLTISTVELLKREKYWSMNVFFTMS